MDTDGGRRWSFNDQSGEQRLATVEAPLDSTAQDSFLRSPAVRKNAKSTSDQPSTSRMRPTSARKLEFDVSPQEPSKSGRESTDSEPHVSRNVSDTPTVSARVAYSDRFIPSRLNSSLSNYSIFESPNSVNYGHGREEGSAAYMSLLRSELLGSDAGLVVSEPSEGASPGSGTYPRESSSAEGSPSPVRNVFRFRSEGRSQGQGSDSPYSLSPIGYDGDPPSGSPTPRKIPRKIARSPYKVLDAPTLVDDFYLNLVDWSEHNVLAVGLGACVYLWNASTSKVTKLCDLDPDDSVRAVGWAPQSSLLSVGTRKGHVQIWDSEKCEMLRSFLGHRNRVGTLAWGSQLLSSGGRDQVVLNHDPRVPEDYISQLVGHQSEICGLKWSHDDKELASGGNDNQLLVWNKHSSQPVLRLDGHKAAVKAITWSPHQHNMLASGGGSADRCIRIWNTSTSANLSCVDTGSQVCNLSWSKNVNEIVSTHGYSDHQIIIWQYPSMSKLATLTGHTMRVLFLATSPDGQTIVTGAGDETLRFWNVFPPSKVRVPTRDGSIWSLGRSLIR